MALSSKRSARTKLNRTLVGFLLSACCVASMAGSASAAVMTVPIFSDLSKPVSFSFGNSTSTFTFTSTGQDFFGSPVAVSTTGGAAVRTILGSPSVDFDPPRNGTPYDGSLIYTSFPSATGIPLSGPPSFLGLADTTASGTRYGYAEFSLNSFVGYAFESTPGVAIQPMPIMSVSAVPLPASAPMFGAALLGLAGLGYAAKRKKEAAAA